MPEVVKIFLFECSKCGWLEVSEERFMVFLPPGPQARARALLETKDGLILNFGDGCPNCKSSSKSSYQLGFLTKKKKDEQK